MANPYDDVFGTGSQVDYAQGMAKAILEGLSKGPAMPSADMAKLPGTWMYGIPQLAEALRGKQYEQIAGRQDQTLAKRQINPSYEGGPPKSNGAGVLSQSAPQGTGNIQTASLTPDATGANQTAQSGQNPLTPGFLAKVRSIENSGKYTGWGGANNAYFGAYQFNRGLMAKYGVGPNSSKQEWDDAATRYFGDLRNQFVQKNGREPTEHQLYLMHQRGPDGLQKGLDNPDQPEWVNMYNTGEGRQRALSQGKAAAINWAQNTVRLNVDHDDPVVKQLKQQYGKDWYLHMTSAQFNSQGYMKKHFPDVAPVTAGNTPDTSNTPEPPELPRGGETPLGRFDELTGSAGTPKIKGQAGNDVLSGENASQIETGATRVAQATPGFQTTTPTRVGPNGAIPPPNPIESEKQLEARILAAKNPDERRQIIEDYLKRKEGRQYETPGGKLTVTPREPGQQPEVTHRATGTIPFSVGDLHLQLTPDDKGGFTAIVPDGNGGSTTKNFGSLNEIWDWAQRGHARGVEYNTEAEVNTAASNKRYQDVLGHSQTTYQSTADRGRQLALAQKLVDDPKFISGSLQEQREAMRKFLRTFGIEKAANASDITQTFVKLVAGNILDDIKGLGGQGLGQIRAKEMEIIEKMNASPNMSPGAVKAVVTLMRKTNDRMNDFNDQVLDYASTHNDRLDAGFFRKMQKYYRDNPLISDEEITGYKKLFGAEETGKIGARGSSNSNSSTTKATPKWTKGEDGVWVYK